MSLCCLGKMFFLSPDEIDISFANTSICFPLPQLSVTGPIDFLVDPADGAISSYGLLISYPFV